MSLLSRTSVVVAVWLVLAPAVTAAEMSWSKDLTKAFAEAKKTQKILMICVDAKYVTGRKTEEPAAKGLREVVYKDSRVVAKSREFVCAFLTPGSGASEFGELRALGIDGNIVSPATRTSLFVDLAHLSKTTRKSIGLSLWSVPTYPCRSHRCTLRTTHPTYQYGSRCGFQ